MKYKELFIIVMALFQAVSLHAQTTKDITITNKEPFSDQLAFNADDKDMQLTVKLLFDEKDNTLTLTLTSPKSLFVFWADLRFKDVFSCQRWLEPKKLPYVISSNTADQFHLAKSYYRTFPCCRHKYVFTKWIEFEGLKPVINDLKLVNDSIVQTFTLEDKSAKFFTIRLRHVLVMDEVDHKGTGRSYEITYGKDFNQKYRITIQHDPCSGLEDDVAEAEGSLDAVRNSFAWFQKRYANGKVTDEISMNDFQELKQTLIEHFPKKTITSPCPAVQQARDQYNAVVDSIPLVNVKLDTVVSAKESRDHTLITKNILSSARLLDNAVARWLVSKDEIERADLLEECRSIISDTYTLIKENRPQTAEEQQAMEIFRKAEHYFKKVCR